MLCNIVCINWILRNLYNINLKLVYEPVKLPTFMKLYTNFLLLNAFVWINSGVYFHTRFRIISNNSISLLFKIIQDVEVIESILKLFIGIFFRTINFTHEFNNILSKRIKFSSNIILWLLCRNNKKN